MKSGVESWVGADPDKIRVPLIASFADNPRSAEFYSAVSQISNLQGVESYYDEPVFDTLQVGNLRYGRVKLCVMLEFDPTLLRLRCRRRFPGRKIVRRSLGGKFDGRTACLLLREVFG